MISFAKKYWLPILAGSAAYFFFVHKSAAAVNVKQNQNANSDSVLIDTIKQAIDILNSKHIISINSMESDYLYQQVLEYARILRSKNISYSDIKQMIITAYS